MVTKISYRDIPKYCDNINIDKENIVELSQFQAWLYKKVINHKLKPLNGLAYYLDMIYYTLLLVLVFISSRNLLLLAYFHRQDCESLSRIIFKNILNDKVEVTFNSFE